MSTKKRGTDTEISDEKSGIGMKEEEQLLAEALKRYDDELIDEFFNEEDDEKPVPLTEHGRQGMKHLLEQWVGPEDAQKILQQEQETYEADLARWKKKRQARLYRRMRRWGTVAAAAVFTLIISTVNVQDSLAFKLPTAGFKAAVKDDYTQLFVEDDEEESGDTDEMLESIQTYYVLDKTLPGYELVNESKGSMFCYYEYQNYENRDIYIFTQQTEQYEIGVNTEYEEGIEIDTLYGNAIFYTYSGRSGLSWNYSGYSFRIEGNLSQEEILMIQSSLVKEDEDEKTNS